MFGVRFFLFVLVFGVGFFVARCALCVDCCLLFVICCLLFVFVFDGLFVFLGTCCVWFVVC